MLVEKFNFFLPEELIATEPAIPRDNARMLFITNSELQNKTIKDLPELLQPDDVLVFNNTKVIPALLKGKRGDATVEANLHKKISNDTWKAFAKPAKKLRVGDNFTISEKFYATVKGKGENGEVTLKFNVSGSEFDAALVKHGLPPLPPYIAKKRTPNQRDNITYQTIFAREPGAVAAPTAGLHFTDELLTRIKEKGVKFAYITLHVGAGTFLPVKVEDTKDHKMHSEYFTISSNAAETINSAKRIIAVGTTSLRALESACDENGKVQPYSGETDIFITPGYKFKTADLLLTNFHLPRSTLFMLVSAFVGEKTMHEAYSHAIENKYRFYSYGDACLLEKK